MIPPLPSSAWLVAAIAGCCALAAAPLAVTPIFAIDWVNHCWFAAYVAHVLASDGMVPTFVNTTTSIGNPILTFYGTTLYVALAPFVWLFGAELGMRVAVLAALVVPALAVARLFLTLGIDRLTTVCVTICVSSSVYQLTNIYSRGAVTEFFAYQLLLLGMALLLTFIVGHERAAGATLVFGTASLVVGGLAHPPTFAMAGLFLAVPAAVLGVCLIRPIAASIRTNAAAWALAASAIVPAALWLPIVVNQRAHLGITQRTSDLHYFPFSIDHWLARVWPAPIDLRVLTDGYNLVSTPFLAAPVNSILLTLLAATTIALYRRRRSEDRPASLALHLFVVVAIVAIVAPFAVSLPLGRVEPSLLPDGTPIVGAVHALPGSTIGRTFGSIQFAYRLVNVVNLAAILALLGVSILDPRNSRGGTSSPRSAMSRYLLVAVATASTLVMAMKVLDVHLEFSLLPHIGQQLSPIPDWKPADGNRGWANGIRGWTTPTALATSGRDIRDVDTIPPTQYGIGSYAMPTIYKQYVPSPEREEVGMAIAMTGHSSARAEVRCARRCVVLTNLYASSFASITVDGTPAQRDQLSTNVHGYVAIAAEPGAHTIEVQIGSRSTTALAWGILWLVIVFWTGALAVLAGAFRRARGRDQPTTLERPASELA